MSIRIPQFPEAKSDFINGVVGAFRSRSKAIKYSASSWMIDLSEDGALERMNVDVEYLRSQVRLAIWDDGRMWFRACRANPSKMGGWEFNFAFHLHATETPQEIVDAFERSYNLSSQSEAKRTWAAFKPEDDPLI